MKLLDFSLLSWCRRLKWRFFNWLDELLPVSDGFEDEHSPVVTDHKGRSADSHDDPDLLRDYLDNTSRHF